MIGQGAPWPAAAALDSPGVAVLPRERMAASNPLRSRSVRLWAQTQRRIAAGRKQFLQWPPRRRLLAVGVAGAMLCLVLAAILVLALRPAPIQKAVATARVAPPRAVLYKEARLGSSMATLMKGDRVNVLRIPGVRDRVVPVQLVVPKALRPGYMRISDLGEWGSADPEANLALIRLSTAGPSLPSAWTPRSRPLDLRKMTFSPSILAPG